MAVGTNLVSTTWENGVIVASLSYSYDTASLKMTSVSVMNNTGDRYRLDVQNQANGRSYGPFFFLPHSGTVTQALPQQGNQAIPVAIDTDGSVYVPNWTYQFGPTTPA